MSEAEEELTGADADYGYRFGCDGVTSLRRAAKRLDVHENTIRRYCDQGLLRKGKRPLPDGTKSHASGVIICNRSIAIYFDMAQE